MTEGEGFKNAVAEIKHAYDIRDYIEAAGVTLKPAGAGRWKGLCPFHDEKTPSFTVDESFQNYRCFGCGASGDLITFTQEHDGLGFMDALTILAADKGIVIPDTKNKKDDAPSVDYAALRECVRTAANYFWTQYRNLPEEHPAVREVTSRGLNPNSGMYGYAPEGRTDLYQHLKSKGFSDDTITTTGVCSRTERGSIIDFWSGRLIFYIQDTMGKVVGFSGRRLYDTDFKQGKYVNSPATPLFHKSKILYNLPQARKILKTSSTLYVAEGQFDVIALAESGIGAVVAGLGTAFTPEQGSLCRRMVGDNGRIVFCFDGDQAGVKAALKVFTNVPVVHSCAYVSAMPESTDPCDLRMKEGPDALKEHVETQQVPLAEFVLDAAAQDYNLGDTSQRARYIERAASVIKTISSHILSEEMIRKVSLDTFSPTEVIRDAVNRAERVTADAFDQTPTPRDTTPERPDLDDPSSNTDSSSNMPVVDQDDTISLIDTDPMYAAAARSILLAIRFPQFREGAIKQHKVFPPALLPMLKDLHQARTRERIIPEDFTHTKIATHIMSANLIPTMTIMSDDETSHLNTYLLRYLTKAKEEEQKRKVQEAIMATLNSSDSSVSMLRKAISEENRLLGRQ